MTDAERQACERIAVAMGLEGKDAGGVQVWTHPNPTGFTVRRGPPPNFFADPVAADALFNWLAAKPGWYAGVNNYRDNPDSPMRWLASVNYEIGNYTSIASSWMAAVANAADAAIQEADNAKL